MASHLSHVPSQLATGGGAAAVARVPTRSPDQWLQWFADYFQRRGSTNFITVDFRGRSTAQVVETRVKGTWAYEAALIMVEAGDMDIPADELTFGELANALEIGVRDIRKLATQLPGYAGSYVSAQQLWRAFRFIAVK